MIKGFNKLENFENMVPNMVPSAPPPDMVISVSLFATQRRDNKCLVYRATHVQIPAWFREIICYNISQIEFLAVHVPTIIWDIYIIYNFSKSYRI
jgi:hypothetical protein